MSSDQIIEPLEKKCPRCGGKSANPSNPSGRCSACLKKLASNKKKPGHWQRAQTKADDALRRQKGKNGTAHKKHSGLGSRKSIVKQTQAAEKKTGEKLSPDRKNNAKGYAASNTRMVPEKLNRGRHHVDEKKLRNWKKKLKKSEIDTASLYTLLKAKAYELQDEALINLVKSLTPETLEQYINLYDIEEFSLDKGAMRRLAPKPKYQHAIDHGDFYYPEKDNSAIKRHQIKLVKDFMDEPNRLKNIDGKLHIKLHRGVSPDESHTEYGQKSPMKINDKNISHDQHGMYTTDYNYAKNFAKNGVVHSAWVPINAINKYGNFTGKLSIEQAKASYDPNIGDDKDFDKYISQYGSIDRTGNEDNHVLVNPGQYDLTYHIEDDKGALEKSAAPKLEPVTPAEPSLASEVGKTHTVEIHPDIDHLYRAKGLIKENKRDHLHIGDYKSHGFPSDIVKKLPRDANGRVTPEMIDKHIESLPKKKINIEVQPYTWGSQQHRPGKQVVLSARIHPESRNSMNDDVKNLWRHIRRYQHQFGKDSGEPHYRIAHNMQISEAEDWLKNNKNNNIWNHINNLNEKRKQAFEIYNSGRGDIDGHKFKRANDDFLQEAIKNNLIKPVEHYESKAKEQEDENESQLGWSRVDPYSKQNHWHIDEIQSDFQNIDKIKQHVDAEIDKYKDEEKYVRGAKADAANKHVGDINDYTPEKFSEELKNHPKFKEIDQLFQDMFVNRKHDNDFPNAEKMLINLLDKHGFTGDEKQHRQQHKAGMSFLENAAPQINNILKHLSHDHQDPQHAIHSAVNALGRKLGIKSISMDTPEDQVKQSNLKTKSEGNDREREDFIDDRYHEAFSEIHGKVWPTMADDDSEHGDILTSFHENNPNFNSAIKKLGGIDSLESLAARGYGVNDFDADDPEAPGGYKKIRDAKLSTPERDAINDYLTHYADVIGEQVNDHLSDHWSSMSSEAPPQEATHDPSDYPVHQHLTYNKRPRKLGMKLVDKEQLLGPDEEDKAKQVQYMNLHKKLQAFLESLKKITK